MLMDENKAATLIIDRASQEMLIKAETDCIDTCFDRAQAQGNQCSFGVKGICCRNCHLGPCRITPKAPKGICGATADTIAARNFLREVAAGTSAHSDHGRHLVLKLKKVSQGKAEGYGIKDEKALRRTAKLYDVPEEGRSVNEVASDLADVLINEFSEQEGFIKTLNLAPKKRRDIWEAKGVLPHGIDRMVVESLHRTSVGVDHDYRNILKHACATSLSNGWGGSRVASLVTDILFGTPTPIRSEVNLGILKKETVNIIVHGHEPELSELLAVVAQDPEIKEYAKTVGAEGVTLAGICCTANEILMRHGVPIAGNYLQQELAIVTGAVEMMILDVQCCFPSLPEVAAQYHTEIVTTSEIAKMQGAAHMSMHGDSPLQSAKNLVKRAIDNYKNRNAAKIQIPTDKKPLVAGFSVEAIKYMLGGRFRASFRPLNDAIIQNRIFGIVGMAGCNSTKQTSDAYAVTLTKELIKRDILVLQTGCAAISNAKAGNLTPEAALEMAGPGLKEICETVGIPPVLHLGSCVDNTRILEAATEVILEGGLGDDFAQVPAVGVAPEWMSEKAISIGTYFVTTGVNIILGNPFHVAGGENVENYLHEGIASDFGACFHYIPDPMDAVEKIVEIITGAREQLGINKKAERKLYDMKDRRDL